MGTCIDDLFGSESFIRMQTEVWETKEFWTSLLNVTFSKFERMKRILGVSFTEFQANNNNIRIVISFIHFLRVFTKVTS